LIFLELPRREAQGSKGVKNAKDRERLGFAAASETLRGRKIFMSARAAFGKGLNDYPNCAAPKASEGAMARRLEDW